MQPLRWMDGKLEETTGLEGLESVSRAPSVERAVNAVRDLLGFEIAYATRMTETHQHFELLRGDGEKFGVHEGLDMPIEMTYCTHILAGRLPHLMPDVKGHEFAGKLPVTEAAGVGAFASVPLTLSDGSFYGTLCAGSREGMPGLGDREEKFLRVLARIVADQVELSQLERRSRELAVQAGASTALIAAVEARDAYTADHSRAVVDNARTVATKLGCTAEEIDDAGLVALLHDIGKVAIPDQILNKPGPLDEAEWEVMRTHPVIGSEMVGAITELAHLKSAVRAEHERWDGNGYPDGISGEAIPLESRITLACDALDAMMTRRPYRDAMSPAEARAEIEAGAGSQFCPDVAAALLELIDEGAAGEAGAAEAD